MRLFQAAAVLLLLISSAAGAADSYQERQAKEGVKVFNWILGALAIGALAFIIYFATQG